MTTGRIVASKYCLLHQLGRGGMGAVWAAEHLALRSQVAVKLIDAEHASSEEARQRFEREARAAAALRSPHVVQVLDFGIDAGSPYLVMELLKGESLGGRLFRQGPLAATEVARIMEQIGRAMTRAHAGGFVHRDLKPDNIFVVDEGNELVVKVLDFGIAKSLSSLPTQSGAELTLSGVLLGTPHYMSAEQAEGEVVDARADVWSMGVIAFECLTGRLPFAGDSLPALLRAICYDPIVVPSEIAPVPPGFDAWFLRALARDPELRFQSAKQLVDELLPVLEAPREQWLDSQVTARGADHVPTLRLKALASRPQDRRRDTRISSSIPAGLDRQRDLRHTALIYNASRSGAVLATRQDCQPGQRLLITLQLVSPDAGETLAAHVVRVETRPDDPIWKLNVAVQFDVPLAERLLTQIEERSRRA